MEVQLYQRSQLPPSRIGAVKPLDIPEISPVEAGAEIGSSIIQQIRATRAGNEQSEYLGAVATAQERAATQIADNPGMPFEDMDKIQKQMMTEIDQAGENLQLPESKLYARNFKLKNRKLIEEKFNTQKQAVLTKHEFTRFNLERERLIAERKPDELNKLYEGVSGKLLDPEVATLSFENDVLTIDALQAKFDEEVLKEEHQAVLEQYAESGRDMGLAEATKFFNEISREIITEPERNGLIAQRKRQEEIATATTNRKVRWDVLRKVTKNPQLVTDEYLEGLVKPNSLTWDDAEEFKKIRDDANEPLKTPRAQLYLNSLNTLYSKREIDAEERLKFDTANEKLVQFFKTNPNATAKQAAEFYNDLVEQELNEFWDKIGKLLRPKETTPFWRHFGTTEEAALARKKAKAGVKEKLTPEIARQFLNLAGGDRKRAEELAKEAGYEW